MNNNIEYFDKSLLLLNKIKKRFDSLNSTTTEQIVSQPYQFEKQIAEIKKLLNEPELAENIGTSKLYEQLTKFIMQKESEINKYKEEYHFQLGSKMKEMFSGFGEVKGQLPILRVKFYTIKFDFANGEVTIWWGPEKELIKKIDLNLDLIIQTVKSFDENLNKMWNRIEDFFNTLKSAYERYIKINNLSIGAKVNLLDVLSESIILMQNKSFRINPIKTHFTEYSRIQFSYDLYRLKTTSQLMENIQLSVATFAITENREKSLWIPDNEMGEGTYYQTIAIR
ncbi:MAG: hypothetical protein N2748_05050 [candidate division WOR-3 bacterium]|nr:hypothetical protein [candidate division WOR-3 bacterium]